MRRYGIYLLSLLAIGILILQFSTGPLRYFGGDVIAVMFLYFFFRATGTSKDRAATATLLLAVIIEILQLVIQPTNPLLLTIFGNTADTTDILMYMIGVAVARVIDMKN